MKKIIVLGVTLITINLGFSQLDSISSKKDLKVGVVMSGGGAKGFAHVGVLKKIEEAGIRIDYIGGTSMGAIVGALYSSGYNAVAIDSILKSYNYTEIMQDKLPRKAKSINQKENSEKYAIKLPIYKGKIGLPSALSKGQNVFNELTRLTEHVHSIEDFSRLPIPFFCVATNLETGEEEILERGFLPEAIKASGAFPSLLDPVLLGDKLMVDGGVVNNFPVDIMRKKGVDIIIGLDVQDGLRKKEEIVSAPEIIMQIISFQMYDEVEEKKKQVDYYVHPDIKDYNVVSFDKIDEIIKSGEHKALDHFEAFKEIASQQKKTKNTIHNIPTRKAQSIIEKIIVKGNKNYTTRYVRGKLGFKKNKVYTYNDFKAGLNQLAASGNFKSFQYKFINNRVIEITLKETDITSFVNISAHYDDLFKTSALLNFTSSHLLFKNDVLSTDLILGDNIRYNVNYFIDNGFHWSYGLNFKFNRFGKSIFESTFNELNVEDEVDFKIPTEYNDFTNQFFLQNAISNTFAVRIGAETKYLRVFDEEILNNKKIKNFNDNRIYGNAFAEIKIDNYDNYMFPKKGMYLNINYKAYLFLLSAGKLPNNFTPFTQLKGELSYAHTFGNKFTTQIGSAAGVTIGENENKVHNFHLGGNNRNFINNFTHFYGYEVADLSGGGFLKSYATVRYELFKKNHLSFTANAARVSDDLFNKGRLFEDTRLGYAVGYGIESFLGPIEIKYTWSPETGLNHWFFNVGFWF